MKIRAITSMLCEGKPRAKGHVFSVSKSLAAQLISTGLAEAVAGKPKEPVADPETPADAEPETPTPAEPETPTPTDAVPETPVEPPIAETPADSAPDSPTLADDPAGDIFDALDQPIVLDALPISIELDDDNAAEAPTA